MALTSRLESIPPVEGDDRIGICKELISIDLMNGKQKY